MKLRIVETVTHEIEVPDGATHYVGELLDNPTWWKYSENETGTFKGWSYYNGGGADPGWYIGLQSIEPPKWTKPIGAVMTVMESRS